MLYDLERKFSIYSNKQKTKTDRKLNEVVLVYVSRYIERQKCKHFNLMLSIPVCSQRRILFAVFCHIFKVPSAIKTLSIWRSLIFFWSFILIYLPIDWLSLIYLSFYLSSHFNVPSIMYHWLQPLIYLLPDQFQLKQRIVLCQFDSQVIFNLFLYPKNKSIFLTVENCKSLKQNN